ncbi:MAG: DNA repair exonuclease [Verrucomicrobiota bacterium JB023]|nr:DNA repair exonuclease [Verrucomicrobiota bacterium JB023]
MFRFIHAADLHLDSPLVGLSKVEGSPIDIIQQATRQALVQLVDLAIEESVAFIVLAGDLYDGDWKDYRTGLFFVREMRRLEAAGIHVYLISGNHDAESKLTKALSLPANVFSFPTKKAKTLTHPHLPVSLHGQGFATAAVTENLAAEYPAPVVNHLNIGLLHTNVGDREGHGNYAPSRLPELVAKGYDYWALGHIHQRSILNEAPAVVYSGNTQGRNVRETGAKGCYLVEVNEELAIISLSFRPLDSVRWENLVIDCEPLTDRVQLLDAVRAGMEAAIERAEGRLVAVRVTLTGASYLHESLHSEFQRFESECLSLVDALGSDCVWFEKLKVRTTSRIDPVKLAQQDELTALVLESLEEFDPSQLPKAVSDLRGKLAQPVLDEVAEQLDASNSTVREEVRKDVSAIVLHAISTSG